MRQLLVTIVVGACLCVGAAEEGHDLKSLVRPQTFSCELRDVRLTRAIDEMSSGKVTINREHEATTTKRTQSGSIKGTMESSSGNVTTYHKGYDEKSGRKFNVEGGLKWGIIPSGSIGGGVSYDNLREERRINDRTKSNKLGAEVSVTDTREGTVSSGQENLIEDSVKSRLGGYKLAFSVVLKNRDVNDELQVDGSRMCAKLRGPGLTGVISAPCSEQGEFTLGVDEKSFEFVYPINDERTLRELVRLDERNQLGQLTLSQSGTDIPVVSKKSGKRILSEQSVIERRNPTTAVSIEFGELLELPSWRVSRRHTAKSGRRGTFVTLRESLQGIELRALEFSDSLPEKIFEFSKDGALARVLDSGAITKDGNGYHMLALRLKDNVGKISLGIPLADRLAINLKDYSEIAVISFTFDEFDEWAVQFPMHFAGLKKEIEDWLVSVNDNEALSEFRKKMAVRRQRQYEEDIRPLPNDSTKITKNDVERYRERANAGVPEMQVKYARCLVKGWGITKDEVEAVKWYRKAAEQGNADGQVWLGECYMVGTGVTENETEAVKWFRKAAEQGNADGQVWLGECYMEGTGVTEDETEAVKWFRKAAEQGNAEGQFSLGRCYMQGTGVTADETEAVKWYRKAAAQGNAEGQVSLGYCYMQGTGVSKDETEAVKCFRKAAEQGNEDAIEALRELNRE